MMTNKGFENWKMADHKTAPDGRQMMAYELDGLDDYGVTVIDADYMPGGLRIEVRTLHKNRYTLDVYVDSEFDNDVQTIRIQTSGWGAMESSEIDKVVAAYTAAQKLAHEIERAFPQCFKAE